MLTFGLYCYAFEIEPNRLVTKYETITLSENAENEINILVFSDTHYRADFFDVSKHVNEINKNDPDIVFFVGDLIDDYKNDPIDSEKIIEEYSKINAKYGKYTIMGNHDYGGYADKVYKEIMQKSGFELIINDSFYIEELNINILGMDDSLLGDEFVNIADFKMENAINILLSHEGDILPNYQEYYDFAVSGHSHGGQINLPYLKNLVLPIGAEEYIRGYYEDDRVYTTSGIGTTKIHARFLVTPEIVSINLKY